MPASNRIKYLCDNPTTQIRETEEVDYHPATDQSFKAGENEANFGVYGGFRPWLLVQDPQVERGHWS